MWEETINKQLLPILVNPPPPFVPGLMVTYSLILLLSPISRLVSSPLNFKSCGSFPIEEKGYILLFLPIFVLPIMLTWDWISELSYISTFGPITLNRVQFLH